MKAVIKFFALLLCFALATWFVYQIHGAPQVGIDDANIFFSYAENLAAGKGIVYANNPERVEGFTSFLWMLIGAFLSGAGFSENALLVVSLLLLTATHALVVSLIGRRTVASGRSSAPYQLAYVSLIALSAPYMTWMTITLMDTCLWGLVLAVLAAAILYPPEDSAGWVLPTLAISFAPLVRPESMLVIPCALLLFWRHGKVSRSELCTRASKYLIAVFALVMTLLTCFRLWYFGYPLPNTYYAKVSPSLVYNLKHGLEYLFEFVSSGIVVGAGVALLLVFLLLQTTRWRLYSAASSAISATRTTANFSHFAAFIALLLLLPVLTGGDHFAMSRFYQPVFPLLCLVLIFFLRAADCSLNRFVASLGRYGAGLLIMLAVLDYSLLAWGNGADLSNWRWESPLANEFRIAEKGISLGHRLNSLFESFPAMPEVALITVGGIARSYRGPIIDLMGLNNTAIAHYRGAREGMKNHAAFEKELFFSLSPDILIGTPPGDNPGSHFTNETLKGLLLEPDFVSRYRYGSLNKVGSSDLQLKSFFSRRFLAAQIDAQQLSFLETMQFDGTGYVKAANSTGAAMLDKF